MGSRAIQLPIPISNSYHRRHVVDNYTNSKTRRHRCLSSGRSGGSRWDWDKNVNPNRRSRFSDTYVTDDYDEDDEYRSRNTAKQRMWWSDDSYDEEDEGFGILEASIGFDWVLKVFRAFGWMIPAVIISLLLGTGPNTILMTVALPLAQSAFSLAADTLWGTSDETLRPKSKKSKKRPFTSRTRAKKEKETRFQTRNGAENYKSWVDANNASDKNGRTSRQNFGGWDELDKEPRATPIEQADEPRARERVKISRRKKDDTPLLTRLLIAMFPFLGFWTKLF
ncbi:hypothetical protein PHJA_001718000 [Phtheirospermum japonicum]|uniref:Uncharacterized protein n=1 Tax=Phtheirospermum japonicum TaxID=374723 RepID=A0A830CFA2_9LAMI|nr:hypothetical protein PHJA_001718000 [Phtheirospermum japonicum]